MTGQGFARGNMQNKSLANDYLTRAQHRIAVLQLFFDRASYADVVCEGQEVVELCLKALLRKSSVDVPRLPDVSAILQEQQAQLPAAIQPHVKRLCAISRSLRRDRELAFYGTEDLTPSDFYQQEDAAIALRDAKWVYETCKLAFA